MTCYDFIDAFKKWSLWQHPNRSNTWGDSEKRYSNSRWNDKVQWNIRDIIQGRSWKAQTVENKWLNTGLKAYQHTNPFSAIKFFQKVVLCHFWRTITNNLLSYNKRAKECRWPDSISQAYPGVCHSFQRSKTLSVYSLLEVPLKTSFDRH